MSINFIVGLIGGAVLVLGSAWPDVKVRLPVRSVKNWLFALGALFMLTYSSLNYMDGGPIFFIFLQCLAVLASVMMFLNTDDRLDAIVIGLAGFGLVGWSLFLFEDYSTLLIVAGIIGIAFGYVLKAGTVKRNLALLIGSILIALFSWVVMDWIFFWLNVFFALFSAWYAVKAARILKRW